MKALRHLEVVSTAPGDAKMVIASVHFAAGDTICAFTFDFVFGTPTRHTVQIGGEAHVIPLPIELQSVNHSCDPNVAFDVERLILRALRGIAPGAELRYFYPSTEWAMAEPFDCGCGAPSCMGRIQGASSIPAATLRRYELAPHIHSQLPARTAC